MPIQIIRESDYETRRPAIGLCHCGEEVTLSRFTNACPCGTDYDSNGGLLAPRSQWGEETGECASDVLAVDYSDDGWDPWHPGGDGFFD